jgi:hypothetical protein
MRGVGQLVADSQHLTVTPSLATDHPLAVPSRARALATLPSWYHYLLSLEVLTARRAGPAQSEFLVIALSQVSIASYSIRASAGSLPQDVFGLTFTQIKYEFFAQRQDGGLDPPVTFCFDLAANKIC